MSLMTQRLPPSLQQQPPVSASVRIVWWGAAVAMSQAHPGNQIGILWLLLCQHEDESLLPSLNFAHFASAGILTSCACCLITVAAKHPLAAAHLGYADLLATGVGLLFGAPLPLLFWGGLAVPFVAAGLVARFWPLLRTIGLDLLERARHRHKFWKTEEHGGKQARQL
jgi:hypothetical protein